MGYALGFQLPMLPERRLLKDGAQRVGNLLSAWSGPGWPDPETERRYEESLMSPPSVAHSALEHHRWYPRSRSRLDGIALHADDAFPDPGAHSPPAAAPSTHVRPCRARARGSLGVYASRRPTGGGCSMAPVISRTRKCRSASTWS